MSRAGTPTDNPIIESLNGWIKEEMRIDFNLNIVENITSFINDYIHYFNNEKVISDTTISRGLVTFQFSLIAFGNLIFLFL